MARSLDQDIVRNHDDVCKILFTDFKSIEVDEFLGIIKTFSYSKSSGVEELNTRLLLDAMKVMPVVFIKICNCSLSLGVFPTDCKVARLTIIPKKGDIHDLDNLRPISILPLLGKVLEKHAKSEIVKYFDRNNLFFRNQFGFRKNRSTFDTIF